MQSQRVRCDWATHTTATGKKNLKNTNIRKLNNILLNKQEVPEEIRGNKAIPRKKKNDSENT